MSISSQQPKKVLIVEDENTLLDFFVFDFSSAGYEVFAAHDGEEALHILDEQHVDAVVSDIQLPKKSGIEVLEQLRTARDPSEPAYILISGNLQLRAEQYFHLGVNAFFNKPFNRGELLDALGYYVLPRGMRWQNSAELNQTTKGRLDLSLDSYKSASQEGVFRLGQGGFFLALDHDIPEPGDRLSFQISFADDSKKIAGVGEVRWVRFRSDSAGGPGVGIEIKGATSESVKAIEKIIGEYKPIPFIPKA